MKPAVVKPAVVKNEVDKYLKSEIAKLFSSLTVSDNLTSYYLQEYDTKNPLHKNIDIYLNSKIHDILSELREEINAFVEFLLISSEDLTKIDEDVIFSITQKYDMSAAIVDMIVTKFKENKNG